jgi:hypothetical protein
MSFRGFFAGFFFASFTIAIFSTTRARAATITPSVEWERSVATFGPSALVTDGRGRVGLVGATSNRAGVFLFNSLGDVVASAAACWPGTNEWSMPAAVSDEAGRIFFAWARPFWAVSFERDLRAVSRLGFWSGGEARLVRPVPDERGGVFVGYGSVYGSYVNLVQLGCRGNNALFNGRFEADQVQALVARRGSRVYLVNSLGWSRYSPIRVLAWEDDGTLVWERTFGSPPNEFPYAVALDAQGNLLIAGTHRDLGQPGPCCFRPVVLKVSPAGDLLWRVTVPSEDAGSSAFTALLVEGNDIYAGALGGLFKFTPAGVELWRTNVPAQVLRAAQGNVVAVTGNNNGMSLRKISSSGEVLWETSTTRAVTEDEMFVDAAVDNAGAVYIATRTMYQPAPGVPYLPDKGFLRKYVEQDVETQVKEELEVPVLFTCEPLITGPCDVPPPGTIPPPPSPLPEVTATRNPGGTMTLCWPTNFAAYQLEGTKHVNKRDVTKTKWIPVTEPITTNTDTVCTTAKISRFGKFFRLIPPQ